MARDGPLRTSAIVAAEVGFKLEVQPAAVRGKCFLNCPYKVLSANEMLTAILPAHPTPTLQSFENLSVRQSYTPEWHNPCALL